MIKPFKELEFHEQVRAKRRELNFSQRALAIKSKVSTDLITRLEQGKSTNIGLDNLRRISFALDFFEWNIYNSSVKL